MANIPTLSDEELLNLQAEGKLTPSTVQLFKDKRMEENPVDPTVSTAQKVSDFRDRLFSGKGFAVTPEMEAADKKISERISGVPTDAARDISLDEKAPEKVDLSQLAISQPQQQAVAQPVQAFQNPLASSGLNQAYGNQLKGIEGMQKAQEQAGQEQANVFKSIQQEQLDYNKQIQEINQKRQQEVENHFKNMEIAQKKLEDEAKINPNKYWEEKSTGSKIAATIGLALGAIGSAISGGENQALKILNNAIERDVDAQKNNYNMSRNKLTDKQNAFQLAMKEFGDQNTALLASKSSALGVAELKLKEIAAKSQSEEAKGKAQFLSGQIMEERGKLNAAISASLQKNVAARQASMGQGVEDPSVLPEEQQKKVVKMPNGLYKPAISEQGAKVVNEQSIAASSIRNIISQLKKLSDPAIPLSTRAAQIDGLKAEYTALKKNEMGLGVMSDSDRELVEATIGNPGSLMSDRAKAMLDQAEKNVDFRLQRTFETYVPNYKPINVKRY